MKAAPFLTSLLLLLSTFYSAICQVKCVPTFIKQYNASGHMEPHDQKVLPDGSVIIAGRGTTALGATYHGMVTKLSENGTVIWSSLIGAGGTGDDNLSGVCVLQDGSIIVYGTTTFNHPEGKGWIARLNSNGTYKWSLQLANAIKSTDRIKSMQQLPNGDLIGTFNVNDSTAASNPVVFRMALDGTLLWAHTFDNGNNDSFTSLAFDGQNTIYAGGFYTSNGKKGKHCAAKQY